MISSTGRLACSNFTRRLCSSPFHPLRLTKNPCLSLLQRCKTLNQLKQLHCQILMSGLLASSDVANRLMIFLTNPETGELDYAQNVFDSLPNPSLFIYNLMIKALAKKGCPKSSLLLFHRMREAALSPDNFTYPFVLKAVASIGIFSEGRKAHGLIVKSGFEFDPYVRNSLMNMYAEMGCVEIACFLFDETHVRDVVCWNVLIAIYIKCGKFEEAVAVFRMMERERVEPDEATLVSTLSACIQLGNLELGKGIHRYMNERSRFSIPASNALLDLYVKCGCVDMARTLFDDLPAKNVISWTTMISGYVSSGLLDEGRKLFDRSPTRDVVLWTAMINGYVQYNYFEEALAMSREMQLARIKPDKFTVVSLLTICANFGALEQGKWIHGYIEENMIKVDLVVATALIDMYAKCGSVDKSLEIFKRAERKDRAMWTSIICGHAMNGQTDKALELFSEMKREGVQLDDITFIGVLSACSHGGLVEKGRRHFREMKELHHIEPKPEHYACLVDLLGRAGLLDETEKLIRSLPSVNDEDVLPLWGALLGACRIHGNVDMGHRIAGELIELEHTNSGIQTLIANIYAADDRWEEVTKVRRKMKDLTAKKIPGCSSIEVNGNIHEFFVRDTSHPDKRDIYLVLNSMSSVMDSAVEVDTPNK